MHSMLKVTPLVSLSGINLEEKSFDSAGPCSKCSCVLPALAQCAPEYFTKGFVTCQNCGAEVNVWEVASNYAAVLPGPWGLTSLGAAQSRFAITMETDKFTEVQLTDHGVPEDAKVLNITYNSEWQEIGSVFPQETHGNTPMRRFVGTTLRLIGRPLGEGVVPRKGGVNISVIWVRSEDSLAWPYIVSALESFGERDYSPALMFAQSAVEISIMPIVAQRFKRHAANDSVRKFMSGELSFGHAFNIVLPYFCGELGLPKLPDDVRGGVNRLRKMRNQIVHEGIRSASINHQEAAAAIAAAAVGFEYMRFVAPELSKD